MATLVTIPIGDMERATGVNRASGWYKAASYVVLLTAGMHLLAHLVGPPAPVSEEQRVLDRLLRNLALNVGGVERTMYAIITGYSLFFAFAQAIQGAFVLMLLRYRPDDAVVLRCIGWIGVLSLLGNLVISIAYFPIPPIALSGLGLILFAVGLRRSMPAA